MKPGFEKLHDNAHHSFSVRKIVREKRDEFNSGVWHYHPWYEITFTSQSAGRRFVGYDYEEYDEGDLVLIGENIPHCWITKEHTEQTVINFQKNFLGRVFWDSPELAPIEGLLKDSNHGIKFGPQASEAARPLIESMESTSGFNRLILLFQLLKVLSDDKEKTFLTTYNEHSKGNQNLSNRIEKVYSYVHSHYKDPDISQAQMASDLNMTSSSLCKFVKKVTKKTFYELVLEARINHACKLLVNSDKYVSEICFLSGFNNVSNFNRIFKKIMKKSPIEYRKLYSLGTQKI